MNIDRLSLIYFSPTGTTRRILNGIAGGISAAIIEQVDITPFVSETNKLHELRSDCAIIGVPVYSGRVPLTAVNRIKSFHANKIPAIIVVVYGNRAYEDALLELKNISLACGFIPVACGAFVGEHSFSGANTPIAPGRPDKKDIQDAAVFGARVLEKINGARSIHALPAFHIPGNHPYKERRPMQGIAPYVEKELCTLCGTCAAICPAGAITHHDTVAIDANTCILCHACVKNCPEHAMAFNAPLIKTLAEKLMIACGERKEPEVYL